MALVEVGLASRVSFDCQLKNIGFHLKRKLFLNNSEPAIHRKCVGAQK
jgi:hypothetical protein